MGFLFNKDVNEDDELFYCPDCEENTLSVNWSDNGYAKCSNSDCGFTGPVTACETEDMCLNVVKGRGEVFVCSDCIELHV